MLADETGVQKVSHLYPSPFDRRRIASDRVGRGGRSRRRRPNQRQSTRRYEWAEAGALLHIDALSVPKFDQPGQWATGDRSQAQRSRGAGRTVVIGVVDDPTRLAYCELHASENATNVSACLRRAARWMREQGCGPVQAVMSDNAKCYATSHEFRHALGELERDLLRRYVEGWERPTWTCWSTSCARTRR